MKPDAVEVLESQLSRGEVVLFTGAGFSMGAAAVDGQPIPSANQLCEILWPVAFPGDTFDAFSTLGDVFEVALQNNPRLLSDTIKSCLSVQTDTLPDRYATWFSFPWHRIYTLNIDDLDLAVQRRFDLPVGIESVSARRDPKPATDRGLLSVHLNGDLQDLPNVTFSAPGYGLRIPGTDPWYSTLVPELMSRPVLFVGTELNESPLWQHIALRGDRAKLDRELRPRSYLVTPQLSPARRAMLRQYNIDHIPMTEEQFCEEVLSKMEAAAEAGRSRLAVQRASARGESPIGLVGDLRNERSSVSLAEFLLGREPTWSDLTEGFAVVREFEAALAGSATFFEPRVTLILGTAGSGKTTTLMRLALEAHARGKTAAWLDLVEGSSLAQLKRQIVALAPDVLFVDDIDALGSQAAPFIQELIAKLPNVAVMVASRSTRADRIGLVEELGDVDCSVRHIPHLSDRDIDALVDALDRANRLGALKAKTSAQRHSELRERASRQLIVALIEVTSGRRFDEKIEDECREMKGDHVLVYLLLAIATRFRTWLSVDEVLLAAGGDHAKRLSEFDALVRQHLVVESKPKRFYVRHRVVAERVFAHFRRQQQVASALEGLLFAFSTRLPDGPLRSSREGRLLIRLLNHQSMIEDVGDQLQIRQIYDRIESVMAQDHHYWLQRGSFEVERGDLERAENYLNQARGLAPEDDFVQTEWAYMELKRATQDAAMGASGWRERAEEAVAEINDVIARSGTRNPHPFHVLGTQGLKFIKAAPFSPTEFERTLLEIRATVDRGLRLHRGNDRLAQLSTELEREYLLLATVDRG